MPTCFPLTCAIMDCRCNVDSKQRALHIALLAHVRQFLSRSVAFRLFTMTIRVGKGNFWDAKILCLAEVPD